MFFGFDKLKSYLVTNHLIISNMLQAELIGNLGAAAEVVRTNGSEFIKFRVADTRKWKSADGQQHSETMWVDCIISDAHHSVFEYLKTGTQVYVSGSISTRVYSSQKDRCMKCGLTIHVRNIQLLGGRGDSMPVKLYDRNGVQHDITKWYYVEDVRNQVLQDMQANQYEVDESGWVRPAAANYVEQSAENQPANDDAAF